MLAEGRRLRGTVEQVGHPPEAVQVKDPVGSGIAVVGIRRTRRRITPQQAASLVGTIAGSAQPIGMLVCGSVGQLNMAMEVPRAASLLAWFHRAEKLIKFCTLVCSMKGSNAACVDSSRLVRPAGKQENVS